MLKVLGSMMDGRFGKTPSWLPWSGMLAILANSFWRKVDCFHNYTVLSIPRDLVRKDYV